MTKLAVTGSTGRLGGRVARRLAAAGVEQRLIVRDPIRAPHHLAGASVAIAAYADGPDAFAALDGIDTLFMVSAEESPDRLAQHFAFIGAAVAAGVRHIVYTSFFGAAPDATFTLARDHWATEEHIRASGLAYTFLRDNLYADFLPQMVGDDGIIRGPAGDGSVSVVAQEDVAAVAVAVLRQPGEHDGATYDLTGPESLTMAEIAGRISQATERLITYHPETVAEAYESRARYEAPQWQVDAWVSTYTAIASGEMARVSGDVERIAGHPAMSLADLLAGH